MDEAFQQFIAQMQSIPDRGGAPELAVLADLNANPPQDYDRYLLWIFEKFQGYSMTRAEAGEIFIKRNRSQGIETLNRLIKGSDTPNRDIYLDRDVAITVIESLGETELYSLLIPILDDGHPWQQLEVVDLLQHAFSSEVRQTLVNLLQADLKDEFKDGYPEKVRLLASEKLREIDPD